MVLLRLLSLVVVLSAPLSAQRSRIFLAGQEAGESVLTATEQGGTRRVERREQLRLERMGVTIQQRAVVHAERTATGDERYTWSLQLSQVPMEGEAVRRASDPGLLWVTPKGAPSRRVVVPPHGLVWPEELDARLKLAAAERRGLTVQVYDFTLQTWSPLDLTLVGPSPLPGHPDALHYRGTTRQGAMTLPLDSWISPRHGELRQTASLGGIPLVVQREDLPPPSAPATRGFFDQTLQELEPHPLLPWLDHVTLRWTGDTLPSLTPDPQQRPEGRRLHLRRAPLPTREEAAQLPVQGHPSPEDAPFLTDTPLLQHQDPCFATLVQRLPASRSLSRWELAKAVSQVVFGWIREKDMSVGFASALEVCREGRGDCTEHGVLAVALLRRLGVPARGVLGWVALDTTLGLHFWVEVRLLDRWVPIDPTFDQAPASTLRIALARTDLADLASLGWDQAATAFVGGRWRPEGPWAESLVTAGPTLTGLALPTLSLHSGTWTRQGARLWVTVEGIRHAARAVTRPSEATLVGTRRLQGGPQGLSGRHDANRRTLWAELPQGRWMEFQDVDLNQAFSLLEGLTLR